MCIYYGVDLRYIMYLGDQIETRSTYYDSFILIWYKKRYPTLSPPDTFMNNQVFARIWYADMSNIKLIWFWRWVVNLC